MGLRNSTSKIVDDVLVLIAASGTAGLAIVAPNSLQALEKPLHKIIADRKERQDKRQLARYLQQQKLVSVKASADGSYQIMLTEKGQTRSTRAQFESFTITPKSWDKKWRVIMFDIPEKHKTARDYLSRHLRNLGFKQLQKSVFVFPYPVDEFVVLLNELFPEVSDHFVYMTVDEIDAHNQLVRQFRTILR